MKKFLAIMLCMLMVVSVFAACGSKNDTSKTEDKKDAMDIINADGEEEDVAVADIDAVKEAGKLVIGITEYEPMNFKDENDEWTGFDTEFALAFCEKLGVTAEFTVIDWDNKYTELDAKSIDCIWNGMTITDEGKLNASISNPYVKNAQVVVMANDVLADYADVASMADLEFAVESGSAGAQVAADEGLNAVEVVDQATALQEVASGSVDACIIDITMANAMTGEGTSYADYGYSVELSAEEYGVAFRKNSDLTEEFNTAMATMMSDGTLDALAEKYELTLVK
ncbi:MAG: transporter substrate-binding domain-containing protein [Ruminococcaceae bacterium]|nr:transporter substrate-binding domain-containing protein [Oscillospiraceae bacterium]